MTLSDRMKSYEESVGPILMKRCPAIVRVDGRAFHTFTKGFDRPFDAGLHQCMIQAAHALVREISTARLAYIQSDEISILLMDDADFNTEQWFGGKVQKIVSVAASVATIAFARYLRFCYECTRDELKEQMICGKLWQATFDARCFSIPLPDVRNYFLWRQRDAVRNSINMAAQCVFPHKELHGKNTDECRTMLEQAGQPWEKMPEAFRNGTTIYRKSEQTEWFIDPLRDIHRPDFDNEAMNLAINPKFYDKVSEM